jgi:hypothetical protein
VQAFARRGAEFPVIAAFEDTGDLAFVEVQGASTEIVERPAPWSALPAVEAAPQSRRTDMARVADVMLFGQPDGGAGEFYVSRLWLE